MTAPRQTVYPIGTRIRFTQELCAPADDYSPGTLYAHRGQLGEITGHGCKEGYWVKNDGWPTPFGASDQEFEVISAPGQTGRDSRVDLGKLWPAFAELPKEGAGTGLGNSPRLSHLGTAVVLSPEDYELARKALMAKDAAAGLLAALRSVEWASQRADEDGWIENCCPCCGVRVGGGGHAPGCELAAALAKAEGGVQ